MGEDDVDGWNNGTGTSSTLIPECPCGSSRKPTRGSLCLTKRLQDLQIAAGSSDSCGIPARKSKSKQIVIH